MFSYASGCEAWEVCVGEKDYSLHLFSVGLHSNVIRINFPEAFLEGNISKENKLSIIRS